MRLDMALKALALMAFPFLLVLFIWITGIWGFGALMLVMLYMLSYALVCHMEDMREDANDW